MRAELKVHSLRMSFCLSTDSLLKPYTSAQSLLVELRLETVSRLLRLLLKPATRGSRKSTCSVPLERQQQRCDFDRYQRKPSDKPTVSTSHRRLRCVYVCFRISVSLYQLIKGLVYNANRGVSTEPCASLRRTCKCVWRRRNCFFLVSPILDPSFVVLEFWAFCQWH